MPVLGISFFYNGEDDHAVKRSVTELITPSGYARSGIWFVEFCIVIFIMDCGVFNSFILFQKSARVRLSGEILSV